MRADIHALTGAYAVHALSGPEESEFEAHLDECEMCAAEVRELRETAARLGAAVAMSPPAEIRDRVLDMVGTVRQLPPVSGVVALQRRRPVVRFAQIAASLVLLGALGGLGALVLRQQDDIDRLEATAAQIAEVVTAPDARKVSAATDGMLATAVVSDMRGEAVFFATELAGASGDEVYQLWAIEPGGAAESAGLLAARSDGSSAPAVARDLGGVDSLGVTIEPAGGSEQPTSTPIVLLPLAPSS